MRLFRELTAVEQQSVIEHLVPIKQNDNAMRSMLNKSNVHYFDTIDGKYAGMYIHNEVTVVPPNKKKAE